jgi:hypothetical protein
MKQIGFLVSNLGASQLSFSLIKSFNYIVDNYSDIDPIVFQGTWQKLPLIAKFMILEQKQSFSFNGNLIATDLDTANKLLGCPNKYEKYFYIWNLQWLTLGQFYHRELSKIYNNKDLKLIVRSQEHKKIVENCWQKPALIMNDCHHNILLEILDHEH